MTVAFRKSALALMLVLLIAVPMAAQQVTGELMIRPTDPSGAAVVGAQVQIDAPSLINPVKGTTNADGEFRATGLPPGVYKVTVSGQGFRTVVRDRVVVEVGRTFNIGVPMQLGQVTETVEVAADAAQIDTIRSESATTISSNALAATPGERDFTDYARLLPSVNIEALAGSDTFKGRAVQSISVDGASGAENVFFVDGIDTTNAYSGLSNQGIRTETVQEMQVKTAGYEAEFGGAMGGVISAVTKSGTNNFHGQVYYYYTGSSLAGEPTPRLRRALDTTGESRAEYVQDPEDSRNRNEFGFSIGGPIVKDRLFFFANANPQWESRSRYTSQYTESPDPSSPTGVAIIRGQNLRSSSLLRSGVAKLDFQPFSRVRWSASYSQDSYSSYGKLAYLDPVSDFERTDWGSFNWKYPSYTFASTLNATITNRFLVEGRFGYNLVDRNQMTAPYAPVQLIRRAPDRIGGAGITASNALWRPLGFVNYDPDTDAYKVNEDLEKKLSGSGTASISFNAGGMHNFKAGYQFTRVVVDKEFFHPYTYNRWNFGSASLGANPCTVNGVSVANCGYVEVRSPFGVDAKLHTDRNAFFFQDSWTIGRRLTINPGIRFEKEAIPSFTEDPSFLAERPQELQDRCGNNAFCWSFGDKIAPRFGAAYDLFGNGKAKIYGSWGWFYDQMKLEMAEGSFGGFKWHSQYYGITTEMFDAPGSWLGVGQTLGAFGDESDYTTLYNAPLLRNSDFRHPSFETVDPGLEAMRMSEFTIGAEWEIVPGYVFSGRYVGKRLDRVIEDVGVFTADGDEIYYITNPGYGYSVSKLGAGVPPTPKPKRNYDAMELRLRKPFTNRWSADLSYTYSRLYGIYSGLASSDENGRMDPNVSRDFDLWLLNYTAAGKLNEGLLNTDRPHQIKFNGSVDVPVININFGGFFRAMSGTPTTTTASLLNTEMMINGRNDMGRNPFFTQTDIYASKTFKPFKDEGKSVEVAFNVQNIFNQKTALTRHRQLNFNTTFGVPESLYDAASLSTEDINAFLSGGFQALGYDVMADLPDHDPRYGLANSFQEPISARFGIKFNF